jgi:tRNA(Ile2) C34 agmatinyltransferase TiaS
MPICKICGARIKLSTTGVWAYRCRLCGRVVCRDDYDLVRGLCATCSGAKMKKPLVARAR